MSADLPDPRTTAYFVVVYPNTTDRANARPYQSYTDSQGVPLAFPSTNHWFDDCPTATTSEDLSDLIQGGWDAPIVIYLDDVPNALGWTEFTYVNPDEV